MLQNTVAEAPQDWIGLNKLASFLLERQSAAGAEAALDFDAEVINRLYRLLEIVALVDGHAGSLREHAQRATEHDAMQFAVELRRLANRLQVFEEFLADAGQDVLELEEQLLLDLDDRYRGQSARHYAA